MFGIIIEAINDGLRRTFTIKGRSSKLQYNSYLLFFFSVDFFTNFVNPDAININFAILVMLYFPFITCQIRRSHDVGKSGWWILVPFYSIYLIFKNSVPEKPDTNQRL